MEIGTVGSEVEGVNSVSFGKNGNEGVVGMVNGAVWYVNWESDIKILLLSGHLESKVNQICLIPTDKSDIIASVGGDGTMKLWSMDGFDQLFSVICGSKCTTVNYIEGTINNEIDDSDYKFGKTVIWGDETGRIHTLELETKIHRIYNTSKNAITTICPLFTNLPYLLIGDLKGNVYLIDLRDSLENPTPNQNASILQSLNGHEGYKIDCMDTEIDFITSPMRKNEDRWGLNVLITSSNGLISVWKILGNTKNIETVDIIDRINTSQLNTEQSILNAGTSTLYIMDEIKNSLAKFSPYEKSVIVLTGHTTKRQLIFYSVHGKQITRILPLPSNSSGSSLSISLTEKLIAVGTHDRLIRLFDYDDGTYMDFFGSNSSVCDLKFSVDGKYLVSASQPEIMTWKFNKTNHHPLDQNEETDLYENDTDLLEKGYQSL